MYEVQWNNSCFYKNFRVVMVFCFSSLIEKHCEACWICSLVICHSRHRLWHFVWMLFQVAWRFHKSFLLQTKNWQFLSLTSIQGIFAQFVLCQNWNQFYPRKMNSSLQLTYCHLNYVALCLHVLLYLVPIAVLAQVTMLPHGIACGTNDENIVNVSLEDDRLHRQGVT